MIPGVGRPLFEIMTTTYMKRLAENMKQGLETKLLHAFGFAFLVYGRDELAEFCLRLLERRRRRLLVGRAAAAPRPRVWSR